MLLVKKKFLLLKNKKFLITLILKFRKFTYKNKISDKLQFDLM